MIGPGLRVVKVGGSLFDLPDLGERLSQWIAGQSREGTILIAGGGPFCDAVRELDATHGLGNSAAHWLAIRAMGCSAEFLSQLVPGVMLVATLDEAREAAGKNRHVVLDPGDFLRHDREAPRALPESWSVTSDSIAARLAALTGAEELTLLKSTSPDSVVSVASWVESGHVDRFFSQAIRGGAFRVRSVNLRAAPPTESWLQTPEEVAPYQSQRLD